MSEERESRRIWWITGSVILLLVALRYLPKVENPLAPEPVAAHVALLAEGETVARDGDHELAAGTPFRLFAVLEARDWRGNSLWFSEAPALTIGGREIPADAHRPWPDDPLVKVLWFTVEGTPAYLEVATAEDLGRLHLESNFHPEWGNRWSADGVVDPRLVALDPDSPLRPLPFGTQRYAVRIEFYSAAGALTPERRAAAPTAEAVFAEPKLGTRVRSSLPSPLATVSRAFGRPEVEPRPGLDEGTAAQIDRLADAELVLRRSRLLVSHLLESGASADALAWREVDLASESLAWGREVGPGDLLQAGPRVVVLFRDEGAPGRLDPADRVFDPWQGLRIRRIDEIFHGEGGLELELATLRRAGG